MLKPLWMLAVLFITGCTTDGMSDFESTAKKIDREGIRQTFISHQKDLQLCYDEALKKDKAIQGKLVLDFDIIEGGKVGRVATAANKSTLKNELLEKCIMAQMKDWTFPPPPEKQTVQVFYPLAFSGK